MCGYPEWVLRRVKNQISHKKEQAQPKSNKDNSKKQNNQQEHRTLVVLPYVQGTTEAIQRVWKGYNITTAVRPNTSLRKLYHSSVSRTKYRKKSSVELSMRSLVTIVTRNI